MKTTLICLKTEEHNHPTKKRLWKGEADCIIIKHQLKAPFVPHIGKKTQKEILVPIC
jgi:hypothetical protein